MMSMIGSVVAVTVAALIDLKIQLRFMKLGKIRKNYDQYNNRLLFEKRMNFISSLI